MGPAVSKESEPGLCSPGTSEPRRRAGRLFLSSPPGLAAVVRAHPRPRAPALAVLRGSAGGGSSGFAGRLACPDTCPTHDAGSTPRPIARRGRHGTVLAL